MAKYVARITHKGQQILFMDTAWGFTSRFIPGDIAAAGPLSPSMIREAQMGKYVSRIVYKGKEMLFMNARGVNEDEAIAAWEEMKQAIPKNRDLHLTLIDATNIAITPAILRKAKEASTGDAPPDSRAVFVGMTPIQRSTAELIARGMRLNVHFCDTLEQGKEWLAKEDDKRRKKA